MTTRVKLEPVFVLHRRKYRESSYIVDLFSENYGKVRAITRLNTKTKKALLQPFTPCYASWTIKTELATLQEIEARGLAPILMGEKLICAFYINEIIMKTMTFLDPSPKIFSIYSSTLSKLTATTNAAKDLRIFEKYLLEEIGYGIPFIEVVNSQDKYDWYRFIPQHGFIGLAAKEHGSLSYQTLINLSNDVIDSPDALRECKLLLQSALQPVLKKFDIKTRLCWQTTAKKEDETICQQS